MNSVRLNGFPSNFPVQTYMGELASTLNQVLDSDEIGTFRVRYVGNETRKSGSQRNACVVELDFESSFDAMEAQRLLDKHQFPLPNNGIKVTLSAKVTAAELIASDPILPMCEEGELEEEEEIPIKKTKNRRRSRSESSKQEKQPSKSPKSGSETLKKHRERCLSKDKDSLMKIKREEATTSRSRDSSSRQPEFRRSRRPSTDSEHVLKLSGSRISRSRESRYRRSRSPSTDSDYLYCMSRSDTENQSGPTKCDLPPEDVGLTPQPPIYKRIWSPTPVQHNDEKKAIPENPKFIIPVRSLMRKIKPLIEAADLDEIHRSRLYHITKMRIFRRIKELLKSIRCYLRYKAILDIYISHFPQSTNRNLIEELVAHIKEKLSKAQIRGSVKVEPADDCQEADKYFVERRTVEELSCKEIIDICDTDEDEKPDPNIVKKERESPVPMIIAAADENTTKKGVPARSCVKKEMAPVESKHPDAESLPIISGNCIKRELTDYQTTIVKRERPLSPIDTIILSDDDVDIPVRACVEQKITVKREPDFSPHSQNMPIIHGDDDDIKDFPLLPKPDPETIDTIATYIKLVTDVHQVD